MQLSTKDGFYYIIPSFFKCLLELHKRDVKFSIIFRTFGDDLGEVMEAVTSFCEGKVSK